MIVLASASPRRREILSQLGVPFRVVPSSADETQLAGESPFDYVMRVAEAKVREVATREEGFVLGADTTVVVDDRALAKPESDEEGIAMILTLEGRAHEVATGLCLAHRGVIVARTLVRSRVRFVAVDRAGAARYVASGEGRDKAGGYAIQGLGAGLVRSIEGSYHNVVGLPAVETLEMLRAHGAIGDWPLASPARGS